MMRAAKKLITTWGRSVSILVLALTIAVSAPDIYATPKKQSGSKGKTSATASKKGASAKSTQSNKGSNKTGKGSNKANKSTKSSSKPETSADVKRRQEATAREIRQTEQQIKENEAAVKKNLNALGKLEGDIDISKKKVATASAKVTALQNEIESLETEISKEEQSIVRMRAEYLKAVKAMRGKRKERSAIAFVFASKNFNEALRRMRYLKQFSAWRSKQTEQINARVANLKDHKDRLQQNKQMRDRELQVEVKERNNLQSQYARQDALVVELKKNGQALRSHLSKKQAEANALKGRIASLIAQEQQKAEAERQARERAEAERQAKLEAERKAAEEKERLAAEKKEKEQLAQAKTQNKEEKKTKETPKQESKPKQDKKTDKKVDKMEQEKGKNDNVSYAEARKRQPKTKEPSATGSSNVPKPEKSESSAAAAKPSGSGTGFESMRGALPRPVAGHFKVTSRFGSQSLPDMPGVTYDNPGIDAEVANGATAQAVYSGKVSGVYMIPGYSTVVIVNHGIYYTVYGNLAGASVKVGDTVKQGQALGRVANDEDDPSHSTIHFEVWKNRDKQDPMRWIR